MTGAIVGGLALNAVVWTKVAYDRTAWGTRAYIWMSNRRDRKARGWT